MMIQGDISELGKKGERTIRGLCRIFNCKDGSAERRRKRINSLEKHSLIIPSQTKFEIRVRPKSPLSLSLSG